VISNTAQTAFGGLHVLALGSGASVRIAASWLGESGADAALYRPDWETPSPGTTSERFERHTTRTCRSANFDDDTPYDAVICDAAGLAMYLKDVPASLLTNAATVEITGPEQDANDFDDTLTADIRLWARSGLGYLTRELDDAGRMGEPCLPVNRQASILAGIAGAIACIASALDESEASPPRHIKIDRLELLAGLPMQPLAFAQLADRIVGKEPGIALPGGTLATADGMAYVRPVEPAHWAGLLRLVGGLDDIAAVVESNPAILREANDRIDSRLRAWSMERDADDVSDTCQAEHIPVAPVCRPDQVVRDRHLLDRGFVTDSELGMPWISELGAPTDPTSADAEPTVRPSSDLPLAGLRILDLSWAWAGPYATTLLADLGAEVINVEWHPRVSNLRRNVPFAGGRAESNNTATWWSANQRGKFSIGVNLKSEEGRAIVKRLAARADAVVENFSPGVVDRLGVGFDELSKVNPRLAYVSLSAFGQTGPRSHYIGYGTQVYAASGAAYATSQDGVTQSQMFIPFPDPVSGFVGAFTIAAHVANARATGRSARVDVSEQECMAAVALEPLLDALDHADVSERRYVIAKTFDEAYVALLGVTAEDWTALASSLSADSESSESLRSAARQLSLTELVERVGPSAVHLRDSRDVLADPYLNDAGFWVKDTSPEVAPSGVLIGGSIWHVDGKRAPFWRGAPPLFADTRTVLTDLLDYPTARIDELIEQGAIA
jgi:crotonobetainyl-CoA:carnitine CoA-transferase CaiB-like acyl-CoA transferase